MTFINSLAMAVPDIRREVCNRLMEALGRGPGTFSVPIRDKVTLVRVAWAAHTYDDELADSLVSQTLPPGVTLETLQAYGFATLGAAATAAGYIRYKVINNRRAVRNLIDRLDEEGWEIEYAEVAE
jgi:hypothetical protein